jgi:hypothetical protein
MRLTRKWGTSIAGLAAAAGLFIAGTGGQVAPASAQSWGAGVLLVAQVSVDDPIGKSFSVMTASDTGAGSLPTTPSAVAADVEICGRASQERGARLLVMFDDDASAVLTESGCQTVTLTNASSVTLQAQRSGSWNVVMRRMDGADGMVVGQVKGSEPLGVNFSLVTSTPTAMGELPAEATRYSGMIEVCVAGPDGGGQLVVFVNDEKVTQFSGGGCQQVSVSDALSATLVAANGTWNAAVRRVG